MCGIVGFVQLPLQETAATRLLTDMLLRLQHRGPDGSGTWVDASAGVALGHRRLAILDLSPAGQQPMTSACGRLVMVFNGEIYNHLELRSALERAGEAPSDGWRGHSDTETLLAACAAWGLQRTLQATVGMFALALWDTTRRTLTLARDRMGEKPLYYGWQGAAFLFGSELKALQLHPAFGGTTNWQAASTFLRLNYIPAPATLYEGLHKLLPGCTLTLEASALQRRALPAPEPYWSLADSAVHGQQHPFAGRFDDAVAELERLVRQSVQMQAVADVPVGAFLSGGIDSSTVVALLAETSSQVMTFAIGMPDARLNEAPQAAAVARHLGTRHIEHTIEPHEALELIPRLAAIWDEPLADSSQIPTFLVSQLARRHVTVALSGDGGDEVFLGYPQYRRYRALTATRHLGALPWDGALSLLQPWRHHPAVGALHRRGRLVVDSWHQPDALSLNRFWVDRYRAGAVPLQATGALELRPLPLLHDAAAAAALWDASFYLPDDILAKVDRASMANSLEARAPLLDHRIVEFAHSLPPHFKLQGRHNKRVLREVLYRHVPRALVDRPKMGFSIPLARWLRHELRDWAEDLLSRIPADSEHFDQPFIRRLWQEHVHGQDRTEQLWGLLTLLAFVKP